MRASTPLEHFWSLSVEEQFYFVFPLVVVGALIAGRGRLRPFVITLGLLAAGSAVVCGLVAANDVNRAYFGTDTRAAELAVGALLAVIWFGREPETAWPHGLSRGPWGPRFLGTSPEMPAASKFALA